MNTSTQHDFRNGKEGHEHSPQCRCEPRKEVFEGEKGTLIVFIHGRMGDGQ
jgi:hypothetical protein